MLIDTHCHLDFPEFDSDRDEVIRRAQENGVKYMVNIGSSLKGSKDAVLLAEKYRSVYASVGIHPHDADNVDEASLKELEKLFKKNKVVAVGEIGLDYYRHYSKPENQKALFLEFINIAKNFNLPLVVHCRQAESDTLKVLKSAKLPKVVLHCFSGNADFLKQCLDLGFFISFTCNVTYKKALNLKALVKETPLDRLMLETDAPFLSPEGFRGKRNEPMQVKLLAREVANIKGTDEENISKITTDNAKRFFNLP